MLSYLLFKRSKLTVQYVPYFHNQSQTHLELGTGRLFFGGGDNSRSIHFPGAEVKKRRKPLKIIRNI